MAISLQKGQRVDLTKGNPGLSKIIVGLGWDPVMNNGGKSKGLLGALFGGGQSGPSIDCDASILLLDENGKLKNNKDVVYFGNLESSDRSIVHSGDSLTGEGDGDDEQIYIELNKISSHIHKLVFVVNIYDCITRKQHFGMIRNAYIRVMDDANRSELIKYNLTDDYSGKTSLIVGEIYRSGSEWKFAAVGNGTTASKLSDVVYSYTS